MGKERNDLIDRLQYVGLRLVTMTLHSWPIEANLRVARLLGDFMWRFDRRHRERALGNLHRSFPDMPEKMREAMARRSMQQLFMLFVEVLFTTKLLKIDTIAKYVELSKFGETMSLMMSKERGVIMLTAHYGNWEVLGYAMATLGFETTSIARPLDNPYVNKWLLGVREKQGQRIIAKKGATEEVIAILEKHGVVGFIADQNAGPKGIFVDFFGRKASTYKSIGLLAMQYQVPVVIGYARRQSESFRFKMCVQDIIYPEDWASQPDALRYITQRYTKAIEDFVSEDPGQYLWVHRRWKTRPKGEVAESYD
jgi:KDO2-lipid IV(A) lauroyltransferase